MTPAISFDFLVRLADAGSSATLAHFRTALSPENKAGKARFDPVTVADRDAEAAIRRIIGETFPDHGIIGEEFGAERAEADAVWIIDPIDGTRAFIAGLPLWGTLVGLLDRGRPALGLMAQPYLGELFLGDGLVAEFRRGREIRTLRTRQAGSIDEATLMTTSPRLFGESERDAYERVAAVARNERLGADCYAYCMLAAGYVDLVIEAGLKAYDIAPLVPIIEGAGGIVTTWDGAPAAGGGLILAAANQRLHAAARELLVG